MWTDTSLNLNVLRHGTTLETIARHVPGNVLEIAHGGRQISLNDGSPNYTGLSYSTTGWQLIAPDAVAYDALSGQYLSGQNLMHAMNHDGDSTFTLQADTVFMTDATGQHVAGTFNNIGCGSGFVAAASQGIYFACTTSTTTYPYVEAIIYYLRFGSGTATGLDTVSGANVSFLSITEDGNILSLTYYQYPGPTYYLMNLYSTSPSGLTLIHTFNVVNQFVAFSPMRVAGRRRPPVVVRSKSGVAPLTSPTGPAQRTR